MKLRHYVMVFLAAFAGTFFLASCLNDDNKIPPNCYDGILNNNEWRVDCGGPNCQECDPCTDGIWDPFRGETWRDCGGDCGPCPPCANGIQDGDETGIDCGGSCGGCELLCNDGLLNGNEDFVDCQEDDPDEDESCPLCPECDDGIMNGSEVGIDCGGANCAVCCTSGNCKNGIMDGNEFWVDCGGKSCADCADSLGWKLGGVTDFTPASLPIPASFDGVSLKFENSPTMAGGLLNLMITAPGVGFQNNQTYTLTPATGANNVLAYIGPDAIPYSTSFTGGSGTVTLVKVASVNFDSANPNHVNCHKQYGLYEFFRGSFTGTLFDSTGANSITITNGFFQVTFFTPE